jgi:hypothetical protein
MPTSSVTIQSTEWQNVAGEVAGGAIQGAASGAAAGAAFGPWGAAIGGVVGGVAGLFGGKKKKKANKAIKRANALKEQAYRLRSFAEQRNLLRQGQIAGASAIAAAGNQGVDISSSAFQGARSSIYNQLLDQFNVGETILNDQLMAGVQEQKASKYAGQANTIMDSIGAISTLTQAIPHGGGTGTNGAGGDLSPVTVTAQKVGALTFPIPPQEQ